MKQADVLDRELVIINAAITGMVLTKDDTPYVPISIKEIVADVEEVAQGGGSHSASSSPRRRWHSDL